MADDSAHRYLGDGHRYLGDGLYCTDHGNTIEVYTSNGVAKTNVVWFKPGMIAEFYHWYLSQQKKRATTAR